MKSSTNRALVAKKQSTSFAQVATNLLNVLQGCSKSIRLLLVMFLTLTVSANAWGAEYTITFKSASSDSSSDLGAAPSVSNVVSSGTSYVASFSGCSKMYVGKSGIKLGSGSATGTMNFTLATNYQSNIKSIKVVSAKYGSDTGTLTLYSGNTSLKSGISPGTDYTHTFSLPTKVTSLKLVTSSKRAYITKIVITIEEVATCTTNPTVSAGSYSTITSTTATVSCSGITSLGSAGCSITSYGFVYGTSSNPTISNTTVTVQVGTTDATTGTVFSKELTGLTANTTYYVRPYATNGNGTAYGTQTSFKTLELPKYTVNWYVNGSKKHSQTEVQGTALTGIPVPTTLDCDGEREFVGWTTQSSYEHATDAPNNLITNTTGMTIPENGEDYYAVFATATGGGDTSKQYSFDITTSNFNSTSYAANNNEKTSIAEASDGSTMEVNWTSNQVMLQSGVMQWQKSNGYIYNSTDLGTINSVTVTSTEGTFTTYYGTSEKPSSGTTVGNGYFQIKVGSSATGKTSKVTITFTKTTQGAQTTTYSDYTTTCTTPVNTYTVTFDSDGGTAVESQNIEDGQTASEPTDPTKEGYTFGGWYNGETEFAFSTTITEDINLKAKWDIITYSIEYTGLEGATHSNPSTYTIATETITFAAPSERTGFVFKGWNPASIAKGSTGNKTITATWAKVYTITWLVDGKSYQTGNPTTSVEDGQNIAIIPSNPPLLSCAVKFMGWSTLSSGSTPENPSYYSDLFTTLDEAEAINIDDNKTFHAVFATNEETIEGAGTEWVKTALSAVTEGIYALLTTDGHAFNGLINSGHGQVTHNAFSFTDNIATSAPDGTCEITFEAVSDGFKMYNANQGYLYAKDSKSGQLAWHAEEKSYWYSNKYSSNNWTYDANDALLRSYNNGSIRTYGSNTGDLLVLAKKTTSSATVFTNYVTNCCATPVPTNGSYTSPSGTSVTLTWDGESTRYHITGNDLDDYTDDESYTVTGLAECNEYTFYVSAYPERGCESEAIAITAQPFSGAKTVTFNYNGNGQANTTSSTSCTNQSIELPTPTYSGYRFMGWFTAESGGTEITDNPYTPTDDITLFAHWEKEYTVTYDANGGSTTCANGNYIEGEIVTLCTSTPSKTGYTFAGWTYSPEVTINDGKFTMPASNVIITAQWTINQYTVTWNPNGGKWGESTANIIHTYDYGATINRPADPTRDGYRFIGWNTTVASIMPATNITYTAQWKQNYTITFHDGDDTTPWTQTIDAESIDLNTYVGTHECGEYNFAGWSTDDTQYNDQTANITTWVTGNYTPTANIHLYAVYVKGDLATDFTLNCDGGVYEIWEKGHNQHMAGRQNGGGDKFYTTEYWDANNSESNGAPFTINKVADQTYTLQNADGQYITRDSYYEDELEIEETWENADRYKWTISNGTNGTWRFTNKAATSYALVYYDNRYFELRSASSVTAGNTTTYDLELTPAQTNVYQSNPNCGPYTITFETGGGEFIQGNYKYSTQKTSNLTEPTISKFPAAELDGYTFAGWKDGSPQEDINYEPYLKKADDNLVVSSNKTYHAVYYYYDEEEEIDWSGEFTTGMYAEVNGMKYFLAGTPSSGTMSSTTDCGYVSEVTITPGTGANAGKYKITVNGVEMAPEANETDLLNGTYWWTITERSVGSGEYKISGQDKKNIVLLNSSWGHYSYNQGSEYGNGYYYPRFGKCLEHHWTSNPTPKPSITISGDVYVTATNGRGIMATQSLSVAANNLYAGESLTLSSESSNIYFSAERNVNFVKADKPTASLTLTADATGKIDKEVYVHYKPSTEGDGVPADVVVTATASSVSKNHTIHVRNLPSKFVIATKVGATWYALPADMSSATNPLGVVIEVDETTMTTIAPNTTTYTLWPVKTTATENDRYTNVTGAAYGDRLRFAAVNNEQRGLWANNNNNGSTIRNYAVIDALGDDGLAGYEWKITTTVVDGHWQYTLQTDQDKNQNFLRYWTSAEGTPVGPKWGTYNAGENKLYFLPVTETQPFEYAVVEWYPTKVLIQTDAAITNPVVKIGGVLVDNVTCTNKGGELYEISNLPLETNPNKLLQISFTDNAINYLNTKVVPIILSREEKSITGEPFTTLTQKVYQYADVVVRDGATLSVNGDTDVANTMLGMTIYPTAKVSVAEGKKLSVHSLTFFGGIDEIYDGSTYKINKYGVPQLSLKGILNKTVTTIDYIMRVDLDQMYSLAVPYDVHLADIKYWDGSDIALGSALYVSAYDGEARANQSKKTWIYETDFESKLGAATLKAGVGYTISAELQAGVGNEYSILRMPMMSNVASGATETAKTVAVTAHGIDANVTDNHKGWNLVGNPYMTTIQGADDADLVLGKLKETGTGPWEWVEKAYRYVTIPSDDGTYYWQQKFTDAVLPPFKNFFVQVGTSGDLVFGLSTRKSMPARSTQAAIEKEVEFEILMSNDARQDNTGLLISEEYSPAYEINADLEKMIGSMSVYTIYGGYKLAYNALSPINASEWIPMGYVAPAAGEYAFRLDDVDKVIDQVAHIYLIDYTTNTVTDLMVDDYQFTTDKEQNNNRFAINIVLNQDKDNTTTGMDIINGNVAAPIKFIYHDKMYIQSGGVIYDGTGKQVTNINK